MRERKGSWPSPSSLTWSRGFPTMSMTFLKTLVGKRINWRGKGREGKEKKGKRKKKERRKKEERKEMRN